MKLNIIPTCSVSDEIRARNRSLAPDAPEPIGSGHLAVIGGGPSINRHTDRIRSWDGDIWAVNGAYGWCKDRGIDAWFYSIDPNQRLASVTDGAHKAILGDHCHPDVFKDVNNVRKVSGSVSGPTSAVAASVLALKAGYDKVTFFGCESSYGETCHAYPVSDELRGDVFIKVKCGPESYLTKLEFMLQAEQLADVITTFPKMFSQIGGGLLEALVKYQDYDVTHGSRSLYDAIA